MGWRADEDSERGVDVSGVPLGQVGGRYLGPRRTDARRILCGSDRVAIEGRVQSRKVGDGGSRELWDCE